MQPTCEVVSVASVVLAVTQAEMPRSQIPVRIRGMYDVAYTWQQKGKVTKCSIYLESADAGTKSGTGAAVGCEANGVSTLAVVSLADPKRPSGSQDPKHLADVLDMFKKQAERARGNIAK